MDKMGKEWVKRAKERLLHQDKKATGQLIKSLDYKVSVSNNVIYLELLGMPYGDFVQFGVQGRAGQGRVEHELVEVRFMPYSVIDHRVDVLRRVVFQADNAGTEHADPVRA